MEKNLDDAFAVVLKRLRTHKGLSQEELGFRSGLHRTFISQLERGIKSPTLTTIYRLSTALGVSMTQMLALIEEELSDVSSQRR